MKDAQEMYEIGVLADFYGRLLTKRQYEIVDMYYNYDYSLGEIAENLGISRQGVYDNLKRGKEMLVNFEKKLGFLEIYLKKESAVKNVIDIVEKMKEEDITGENKDNYETIIGSLKELMQNI